MHKIRLFIMCEVQAARQGLAAIFSSENSFKVIGEADYSLDTLDEVQKIQPDAILCEIKLGKENVEIIRNLKETCPCTMLFVLTSHDTANEAYTAIAAGVDSYLTKTMLPCHLVEAVKLTCRTGLICFPGPIKQLINNHERTHSNSNDSNKDIPGSMTKVAGSNIINFPLTAREMEIYRLVVKNYSNKEIGKKLYISQPTVKSHVSSIFRKLGLNNRTQLVLYEMQNKYIDSYENENESGTEII